ncbi:hypothetical protein EcB7A_2104 [Escherichia coli B7A]|nr:hypothetical protein EcB7A_2104 [Escherichia coli B7A]
MIFIFFFFGFVDTVLHLLLMRKLKNKYLIFSFYLLQAEL